MKPKDRDELLIRLDERTDHIVGSMGRLWKAVYGLYGVWAAIIVSAVVSATLLGGK